MEYASGIRTAQKVGSLFFMTAVAATLYAKNRLPKHLGMKNLFWTAYSRGDRHDTIRKLKETVAGYGDLVDFRFFSDISIVVTIEIQERNVNFLYGKLSELLSLDEAESLPSNSERERVIYLNVTFARATGNLTIDVPSVPG